MEKKKGGERKIFMKKTKKTLQEKKTLLFTKKKKRKKKKSNYQGTDLGEPHEHHHAHDTVVDHDTLDTDLHDNDGLHHHHTHLGNVVGVDNLGIRSLDDG